jgi:hypothetical protein
MTKEACVGLFKRADYCGKLNSLSEAFWREFGPTTMSRRVEEKESPVLSLSRCFSQATAIRMNNVPFGYTTLVREQVSTFRGREKGSS